MSAGWVDGKLDRTAIGAGMLIYGRKPHSYRDLPLRVETCDLDEEQKTMFRCRVVALNDEEDLVQVFTAARCLR